MLDRADDPGPGLREQLAEGRVPAEVGPQHDHVHEVADQPGDFIAMTVGGGRAHQDVVLHRVTVQQDLVGREQGHEEGRVGAGGQPLQCASEVRVEPPDHRLAAERVDRRPAPVRRQVKHGQLAGQFLLPVRPEPLAADSFQRPAPPANVILEAKRQGWQRRPRAARYGRVDLPELIHEQDRRPQVEDDVMHHEDQGVPVVAAADQDEPHRGVGLEVERAMRLVGHGLT